jgi:hypothetical protein
VRGGVVQAEIAQGDAKNLTRIDVGFVESLVFDYQDRDMAACRAPQPTNLVSRRIPATRSYTGFQFSARNDTAETQRTGFLALQVKRSGNQI